jgi:phosphopantothenoylcysteine decarboxylase/phosphopantothenate--cysteine ligase
VFVATAAVADWRPSSIADQKIKKRRDATAPVLELAENPDILATVAALPAAHRPYCVGFAAESHALVAHARAKLERKNVPLIVANLGPATFGRDDNGERELPAAEKLSLARTLVAEIAARLGPRAAP